MICTFYSFKGGVGRSMALANVAELLYQHGLNVLIVDFDLEAPGLERFFDVPQAVNSITEIQKQPGIIDMLISYKELRSLSSLDSPEASIIAEPVDNFINFIYRNEKKGALSIISAGYRAGDKFTQYVKKIQSFDWSDFYANCEGEKFFNWFRKEIDKKYDIVLIDSRTGISEMGGVCTYQLADLDILFVAAHKQCIDGTKKMAQSLTNKQFQKWRKKIALRLLFVPSRVEQAESNHLDKFKKDFDEILGEFNEFQDNFLELKIPYVPKYAYTEQIAVRDFREFSKQASSSDLNEAYKKLAKSIAQLASKDTKLSKYYLNIMNIFNNLQFENKKHLVELLLECPSIYDGKARHRLFAELPPEISNAIQSNSHIKTHVLNIVNTCLNFPDGLTTLVEIIRFFDGETKSFQKLTEFINTLDGLKLKLLWRHKP